MNAQTCFEWEFLNQADHVINEKHPDKTFRIKFTQKNLHKPSIQGE